MQISIRSEVKVIYMLQSLVYISWLAMVVYFLNFAKQQIFLSSLTDRFSKIYVCMCCGCKLSLLAGAQAWLGKYMHIIIMLYKIIMHMATPPD